GFYFEQLYINGERRFRAQTPDRGEFHFVRNVTETVLDKETGVPAIQKIDIYPSDFSLLDRIGNDESGDALVVFYHKWDITRRHIQSINRSDSAFYITGRMMKPWNPLDNKTRYHVENYRGALDSPGEWFLSRDGYLYYIPLEGETIEGIECLAPVTEKFIVIEGDKTNERRVDNIRFENLCFRVAGYNTPFQGNEPAQAASPVEASVMVGFAQNIEFINCEVAHTGLYAIWFREGSLNCVVRRCHLHDLGAGGVKIGELQIPEDSSEVTSQITIDNNIIQHGGYVFPCAVGVIVHHGSDNVIFHNDIANFRYSGVSVGWVWGYAFSPSKRNRIEFNHIHHLGWGELCDMAGVYTLGPSEGTIVHNNVVHHVFDFEYGGWGLYFDQGSSYIVMENNLVYRCRDAGFDINFGKENIVRNNIFAFNLSGQLRFGRVEGHKSFSFIHNIVIYNQGVLFKNSFGRDRWLKANVAIDSNCYWNIADPTPYVHLEMRFPEWQKYGRDNHSLFADPLFKDPQNLDFTFKSQRVIKKIGFKPFDYSKAGVYGDQDWIALSKLQPELIQEFDAAVLRNRYTENPTY
ncbi:MAG: right-handed parallel beta-helix repeat-containing protein, partial [Bacteroidales bacterium]|nr:right-handed parallel beta-helix repeat-containing protein [Bacteroidales bacterium]